MSRQSDREAGRRHSESSEATLAAYEAAAPALCAQYEATAEPALASLYSRWIAPGSAVLELGCGSGRDARWLAARGARVLATDGSSAMLQAAEALAKSERSLSQNRLRFRSLPLPPSSIERAALAEQLGISPDATAFQSILAVALLQHLDDDALYRTALLIDVLSSDDTTLIASIPIDHPGASSDPYGRRYFSRAADAYIALFERLGFEEVHRESAARAGIKGRECVWTTFVMVKRSARGAARTNITGLLESDQKTATYKFALLRALCDVNIASPGRARYIGSASGVGHEAVAIPFSLVVERVIEYYWSIARMRSTSAGREPPRQISGGRPLAFEASLRALMTAYMGDWHALRRDFYAGKFAESLDAEKAALLTTLADDVAKTLRKGPVYYSGNSLGDTASEGTHNRLFAVTGFNTKKTALTPSGMADRYGELTLPAALWRELNVCAPFAADAVLLRWAQRAKRMSDLAGLSYTLGEIVDGMLPASSERDVKIARDVYFEGIRTQETRCVWTGGRLTKTFTVDHLLPWSRTHSNDLWNLVPASVLANQKKSDLLPSVRLMDRSASRIISAWRLIDRSKYRLLFRAQAESALLSRALPESHWETPLFDAVLRTTDEVARQFAASRWDGLATDIDRRLAL